MDCGFLTIVTITVRKKLNTFYQLGKWTRWCSWVLVNLHLGGACCGKINLAYFFIKFIKGFCFIFLWQWWQICMHGCVMYGLLHSKVFTVSTFPHWSGAPIPLPSWWPITRLSIMPTFLTYWAAKNWIQNSRCVLPSRGKGSLPLTCWYVQPNAAKDTVSPPSPWLTLLEPRRLY